MVEGPASAWRPSTTMYLSWWIAYLDITRIGMPARAIATRFIAAVLAWPRFPLSSTSTLTSTPRRLALINARTTAGEVNVYPASRRDRRAESMTLITSAYDPASGEKATSTCGVEAGGARVVLCSLPAGRVRGRAEGAARSRRKERHGAGKGKGRSPRDHVNAEFEGAVQRTNAISSGRSTPSH